MPQTMHYCLIKVLARWDRQRAGDPIPLDARYRLDVNWLRQALAHAAQTAGRS